jgi:hypothetical protein
MNQDYDPRYSYVTCTKCKKDWQRLDFGSAHHVLVCGFPLPDQVQPHPGRALTATEWSEFDRANGVRGWFV